MKTNKQINKHVRMAVWWSLRLTVRVHTCSEDNKIATTKKKCLRIFDRISNEFVCLVSSFDFILCAWIKWVNLCQQSRTDTDTDTHSYTEFSIHFKLDHSTNERQRSNASGNHFLYTNALFIGRKEATNYAISVNIKWTWNTRVWNNNMSENCEQSIGSTISLLQNGTNTQTE